MVIKYFLHITPVRGTNNISGEKYNAESSCHGALRVDWCNGLHACLELKGFRIRFPVQVNIFFLLKY